MDKQTLSNYGWLIIITLILAVMLAFATPFGTYVGDGVVSVANGFVGVSNDKTNADDIDANSNKWDLKLKYRISRNFIYYDTIEDAVEALNSEDYSSGSDNNRKPVSLSIDVNSSTIPVIAISKDISITEHNVINKDCIIELNGKTVTQTENSSFIIGENITATICNGNINKTITAVSAETAYYQSIELSKNSSATIENINGDVYNETYSCSSFIYIPTETENTNLTLKNCNIISKGNGTQVIEEENKGYYVFAILSASTSPNATFNVSDCNLTAEGLATTTVLFYGGKVAVNGGKIVSNNIIDSSTHLFSYALRTGQYCTSEVNNLYVTINSPIHAKSSAICNSGVMNLKNSTSICNAKFKIIDETCDNSHYAYALQCANASSGAIRSITNVENCNLIVDGKNTQTSSIRVQGGALVNCKNSKLAVSLAKDENATTQMIGYVVFLNHISYGGWNNEFNVSGCNFKGEIGIHSVDSAVINEKNNKYDIIT